MACGRFRTPRADTLGSTTVRDREQRGRRLPERQGEGLGAENKALEIACPGKSLHPHILTPSIFKEGSSRIPWPERRPNFNNPALTPPIARPVPAPKRLPSAGGKTRATAGPKSEGESYFFVADHYNWWGRPGLRGRASTEDFARDSFENLLFSICRCVPECRRRALGR